MYFLYKSMAPRTTKLVYILKMVLIGGSVPTQQSINSMNSLVYRVGKKLLHKRQTNVMDGGHALPFDINIIISILRYCEPLNIYEMQYVQASCVSNRITCVK